MRLSETDRECGARACEYGKKKRASGCEADICFSALLNEHASVGDRQGVRSTGMRVWKEEESMRRTKYDRECGARACEYGKKKRTSGCEAKETYGTKKSKRFTTGNDLSYKTGASEWSRQIVWR